MFTHRKFLKIENRKNILHYDNIKHFYFSHLIAIFLPYTSRQFYLDIIILFLDQICSRARNPVWRRISAQTIFPLLMENWSPTSNGKIFTITFLSLSFTRSLSYKRAMKRVFIEYICIRSFHRFVHPFRPPRPQRRQNNFSSVESSHRSERLVMLLRVTILDTWVFVKWTAILQVYN